MTVVERAWHMQSVGADQITLTDLGGIDAVLTERDEILDSAELPIVVGALIEELDDLDAGERAGGVELCLSAANVDDPLVLLHITDALVTSPVIVASHAQQLSDALRLHAEARSDAAGGVCLEAVLRLALGGWTSPLFAQALLMQTLTFTSDIRRDEGYRRAGVRALAAAITQWGSGELRLLLRQHGDVEDITDDVAVELGLLRLADAAKAIDAETATERLDDARVMFRRAVAANEARADADALSRTIDLLLQFWASGDIDDAELDAVRSVVVASRFDGLGLPATWRTPRADIAVAWVRLLDDLSRIADRFDDAVWLRVDRELAVIAEVFRAHRPMRLVLREQQHDSDDVDGSLPAGIRAVVCPQVAGRLARRGHAVDEIDRWIKLLQEDESSDEATLEAAKRLREEVVSAVGDEVKGDGGADPKAAEGAATLASVLGLSPSQAVRVTDAVKEGDFGAALQSFARHAARRQEEETYGAMWEIEDVTRTLLGSLADNDSFCGAVEIAVRQLTRACVIFVAQRLDAIPSRYPYLRRLGVDDEVPGENQLAEDMQHALTSMLNRNVRREVSDVGSGRVDLMINYTNFELVIEVKRQTVEASREAINADVGQPTAYLVTSPSAIAFLATLDLTSKRRLMPLRECVWVTPVRPITEDGRFVHVVVMRVQGNKPVPSDLATARR